MKAAFVWVGAGLFVTSLLYFLYFYLIVLGRASTSGGVPAFTIDVALFSIFALHHSLMARTRAKRWITTLMPAELERSTYVWIASLLFLLTCAAWQPMGGLLYDVRGPAAAILVGIQTAGIVVVLAGSAALSQLELAGVRQVREITTPRLQTSGVYGWVRHPVYFGWALFVFAAPRMTMDRFVFALLSTTYLAMAVPFEERSLTEAFGDSYRDYTTKVRWRIVPWLY